MPISMAHAGLWLEKGGMMSSVVCVIDPAPMSTLTQETGGSGI